MINYEILASVRKEKGVTWKFLEDAINGYRGKFVEYKNHKTTLTSDEEILISQILETSLDYLSGDLDKKNKPSSFEDSFSLEERQLIKNLRKMDENKKKGFMILAGVEIDKINQEDM